LSDLYPIEAQGTKILMGMAILIYTCKNAAKKPTIEYWWGWESSGLTGGRQ